LLLRVTVAEIGAGQLCSARTVPAGVMLLCWCFCCLCKACDASVKM
jgi:hypothetical protein